jgi:hypothetical protein
LCRCLEEQAVIGPFYALKMERALQGLNWRHVAKAQQRNEAQQSLAARREARRQAKGEEE